MSMVAALVALSVATALLTAHLLPLERASAPTGIAVWLLALILRAVLTLALATFALVHVSRFGVVEATLNWCWHELLPDLPTWLGFAEHPISHAVVAVPVVVLGASVAVLVARLVHSWLALRGRLAGAVGSGPLGSTVVRDERVFVAVTQLGRGRIVVSDRALAAMDREELVAGLVHEVAHLRRRHRPLLLLGSLLAAIARPLPGTGVAQRQLRFQVERDADAYVVRELRSPLALASAICKVAADAPPAATAALGGRGMVTLRLQELLGDGPARSVAVERASRLLALSLAALAFALAATGTAWALGDPQQRNSDRHGHHCSHR
jgi:Zn-dependent protease with chaperone function